MRRLTVSILMFLICGAGVVFAEIVEIPLPQLRGIYSRTDTVERRATFELPELPVFVRRVSIRVSGEATVGIVYCRWGEFYPWLVCFSATMMDTVTNGSWRASGRTFEKPGFFEFTADFGSWLGASWDCLMDGQGEVTLFDAPSLSLRVCSAQTPEPVAIVTQAVLVLDVEFQVATAARTWGRIKAKFGNTE